MLSGKDGGQRIEEARRFQRLHQVGADLSRLRATFTPTYRGEEDEWQGRGVAVATNLGRERHPIHLRHRHVEDTDVKRITSLDPRQCLDGRGLLDWEHPPTACELRNYAAVGRIIVDDQQALAPQC